MATSMGQIGTSPNGTTHYSVTKIHYRLPIQKICPYRIPPPIPFHPSHANLSHPLPLYFSHPASQPSLALHRKEKKKESCQHAKSVAKPELRHGEYLCTRTCKNQHEKTAHPIHSMERRPRMASFAPGEQRKVSEEKRKRAQEKLYPDINRDCSSNSIAEHVTVTEGK